MRNELLTEVLQQVLRINGKTQHAAFYSYMGHTDSLHVYIAESKEDYNTRIFERSIYMGYGMPDPKDNLRELNEALYAYL